MKDERKEKVVMMRKEKMRTMITKEIEKVVMIIKDYAKILAYVSKVVLLKKDRI